MACFVASARRPRAPLVALGAAVGAFELVAGFVQPAVALHLEQRGASPALIGGHAAMVGLGLTLSALLVPWLTGRVGTLRLGLANLGLASLAILGFGLLDQVGLWFAFGLILGLTASVWYVQSETWLNELADEPIRGRAIGLVMALREGAFAGGPLLIPVLGCGAAPFALMAAVIAGAGVAVGRLRGQLAQPPAPTPVEMLRIGRAMPLLLLAAAASGWFDGAVLPLWVIHALDQGASRGQATFTLALVVVGTGALQLPIGWLADRLPVRLVLAGCALGTALGALLLPVLDVTGRAIWPLLLVWGGLGCGPNTLALVMAGRHLSGHRLIGATATLTVAWGLGALLGAALTGHAMVTLGVLGLPTAIALPFAAFATLAARRPATPAAGVPGHPGAVMAGGVTAGAVTAGDRPPAR